VWGWQEWEDLEAVQARYLRWILELDRSTPGYIVRDECKRRKLRLETGTRAARYEEKIRKDTKSKLVKEVLREMDRKKDENGGSKWVQSRKKYYERCGWSEVEVENMRRGEMDVVVVS
jgi:hypothetical protein